MRQLRRILTTRNKYISEKEEFESFAQDNSPIYREKSVQKRVLVVLATFSFVCSFLILQSAKSLLGVWLLLLAAVLGIASIFFRPSQDEIRSLTIGYLKQKNYPEDDEEIAFRVFTRARIYSDLPQVKHLMAKGLIDKVDLEEIDIDIDMDPD